jgi:hypothetical protein
MPVEKVKGGWRVQGANKVHDTKKAAQEQLKAIKASQRERSQ